MNIILKLKCISSVLNNISLVKILYCIKYYIFYKNIYLNYDKIHHKTNL